VKLGTRLLLALVPTVTAIMIVFAGWALVERERTMVPAAQQETRAYAVALGLALDGAKDARSEQVKDIINQVSREPTIYGIILYDSLGTQVLASDPLNAPGAVPADVLNRVLHGDTTETVERLIDDQRVFSVVRPLHGRRGQVSGALEVAQPLDFLEAQQALVRRRYLLNTIVLLLALSGTTLWLVRRLISGPITSVVGGARQLGEGNLDHRIRETGTSAELAALAGELNRMAENLQTAQQRLVRESEERVTLERRLRETEKLAAIGNLAAGLAHEIAAPMNVISGRAELLLRKVPTGTDEARQLQIIIRQIGRITATVQNLLAFAKRREFNGRDIDLVHVVEGVEEFLEGEFERARVTVVREGTKRLPVRGDQELLHDVLVNLVLNAVQAMENSDGPRAIILRTRAGVPASAAELQGIPERLRSSHRFWCMLEVEDRGPGIAPEALDKVFDPYFTTKASGTGLGLVVAQSIVQEHGGWLDARSGHRRVGILERQAHFIPSSRNLPVRASSGAQRSPRFLSRAGTFLTVKSPI
jgi:signal transduction histidine kinase